jgi:hypothetical protein
MSLPVIPVLNERVGATIGARFSVHDFATGRTDATNSFKRAHTRVDYGARTATAQCPAPHPATMRELVVTAESPFAGRIGASLVDRRSVL